MKRPCLLVLSLLLALGSNVGSSSDGEAKDEPRKKREDNNIIYLSVVMVGRHDNMRGRI